MNIRKFLALALMMLVPAMLLQNCSDEDPSPQTGSDDEIEYFGTQNPGDAWVTFFNNQASIFVMTWDNGTSLTTTDDVIFKGPFVRLPNGYIKMTVTTVVPATPTIPTNGTIIFYAVEIPGRSLFIMPPAESKLGLITMNARSTKAGSNGVTNFNYVRTAFPTLGYEHVTKYECWGKMAFNFNESAGTFSFASAGEAKTLSCAEHDFNPAVACQTEPVETFPIGTTLGTIAANGALVQTFDIDDKIFTGQYTVTDGLLVMDSGEGSGGFMAIKENPSATIAQFIGNAYSGFGSFFGRDAGNNFFLTQAGVKLNTFATDSATITYYSDISANTLQTKPAFGVKFKSMDKGLVKGYLWSLTDAGLPDVKFPFAATTYIKNGRKIIVLVSGVEHAYPTGTRGEQWVFEFVYNP